jgi:hypothetical protein
VARGEREERPEGVSLDYDREKGAIDAGAVMQLRGDWPKARVLRERGMVMSCHVAFKPRG